MTGIPTLWEPQTITKALFSSEGTKYVGLRNVRPLIIDPQTLENVCKWKKTDIPKNRNSIVFGTPPWCENTLCHASFLFVLICLIEGDVHLTSILGPTSYFICILCYRYKDYGVCRAPEIWKGVTYSQLHGAHFNC